MSNDSINSNNNGSPQPEGLKNKNMNSPKIFQFMSAEVIDSLEHSDSEEANRDNNNMIATVLSTAPKTRGITNSFRQISFEALRLQKSRYVFTERVVRSKTGKVKSVGGYEVVQELGRGAYGVVYKVENINSEGQMKTYAMKVFMDSQKTKLFRRMPKTPRDGEEEEASDTREAMLKEIAIMKKLHHPHLIHLVEVVEETSEPFNMFVVMEYGDLGPIMRVKKTNRPEDPPTFFTPVTESGIFGEAQASRLFRELISGMAYLHLNKVAHRDLKPDNVVVTSKLSIKIVDFGVSRYFADESSGMSSTGGLVSDTQGTWPFWAPEMCDESSDDHETYSAYKTDVWAAGVVLWIMIFGQLPFYGHTPEEIFRSICGPFPEPSSRRSPELMAIFAAMFTKIASKRPSFLDCQQFDWIRQHTDVALDKAFDDAMIRIDDSNLDLNTAVSPATSILLSQVFTDKLKAKVARIRETIAERNIRRSSLHKEDSETRKQLYLQQSGSHSFLFDTNASFYPDLSTQPISTNPIPIPIKTAAQSSLEQSDDEFEVSIPDSELQLSRPAETTNNQNPSNFKPASEYTGSKPPPKVMTIKVDSGASEKVDAGGCNCIVS